jgi:hypothetical protein
VVDLARTRLGEGVRRRADAVQLVGEIIPRSESRLAGRPIRRRLYNARTTLPALQEREWPCCALESLFRRPTNSKKENQNSDSWMSCQGRFSFPNSIKFFRILLVHANLRWQHFTRYIPFFHVQVVSEGASIGNCWPVLGLIKTGDTSLERRHQTQLQCVAYAKGKFPS